MGVEAEITGAGAETSLDVRAVAAPSPSRSSTSRPAARPPPSPGSATPSGSATSPSRPVPSVSTATSRSRPSAEPRVTPPARRSAARSWPSPCRRPPSRSIRPSAPSSVGPGPAHRACSSPPAASRCRAELTTAGAVVPSDITSIASLDNETLNFTYEGLTDGSTVTYSAPAGAAGGLRSGEQYTVLDAGTNLIRLGSLFDVATVDALREIIYFTGGHPFLDGDCVYYDPRGGTSMLAAWQGGAQANAGSCTNTTTAPPPTSRSGVLRPGARRQLDPAHPHPGRGPGHRRHPVHGDGVLHDHVSSSRPPTSPPSPSPSAMRSSTSRPSWSTSPTA